MPVICKTHLTLSQTMCSKKFIKKPLLRIKHPHKKTLNDPTPYKSFERKWKRKDPKQLSSMRFWTVIKPMLDPKETTSKVLISLKKDYGISSRTVYKLLEAYDENKMKGLLPKRVGPKNKWKKFNWPVVEKYVDQGIGYGSILKKNDVIAELALFKRKTIPRTIFYTYTNEM